MLRPDELRPDEAEAFRALVAAGIPQEEALEAIGTMRRCNRTNALFVAAALALIVIAATASSWLS